ncbi:HAP1 (YLR256W) [Zygosaccharomyces parabailii]|nr:HAP1 (YLR256W) [Zygosaccharomyces parabailii]CDH16670.1 related to Heme-responsive zinc finger transcription factor HAP1 [Zygosaccharomyces bailii ISA1307]
MSAESSVLSGNNPTSGKLKRKRNRIPLSCTICRKRKVKCDKTRPNCEQCSKTGVAHLCHYMEQTWAEEAEKEISKDSELKKLKNRVRVLEEALVKAQSSYSHTPDSESPFLEQNTPQAGPNVSSSGRHDNDELDLTRQFDMLHLRNNGTIHLGATHWLAIMKGDPYLKLLWGHIFTMKEKLAEWYNQKKQNPHTSNGRCPVMPHAPKGGCPVDHKGMKTMAAKWQSPQGGVGKCPVDHNALKKCPVEQSAAKKCPVDHSALKKCPVNHSTMSRPFLSSSPNPASQYPMKREENPTASSRSRQPSLPSIQNLTSKCPVLHDALPGIQDAVPTIKGAPKEPVAEHKLNHEQVKSRICELLPPKRIICMFLEKFFKQIYPVIPILDESTFKNHMNYMLSLSVNTETENVTHIRMNKLADFCNLGILMIILRLTWLSLPINGCKIDLGSQCTSFFMPHATTASATQAREEASLVNYETPAEALGLVRENLIKFEQISSISNSNVNLTTVQFAIFYKLYLMCWSNDSSTQNANGDQFPSAAGDNQDNETHQVLLSSITQMAFSCGLHRDPDNFAQLTAVPYMHVDTTSTCNNGANAAGLARPNKDAIASAERFKHAWRKTWYYIVSLDVQQSLSLGTPRLLRNLKDFSDTKLPSTSKLDYVNDIKELVIVKNTTLFFQIDLCIIAVLNHVLNVSVAKSVKKFQLDLLINSLSDLTHNNKNICEVLNGLINSGLLHSTEGAVDSDPDNIYGLPSLKEIISQQSVSSSENDVDRRLDLAYESATKALFFSKHLTLRMLLYLLNYILFTHYEPMGVENPDTASIAKSYAQETLNYAMDGYRNCIFFFTNVGQPGSSSSMFNYMEVVLAPQCLDIGHRALQFIVCLILRAKCGPLTGMGESAIIGNNGASSNSEEETEQNASAKKEASVDQIHDINEEISLDTGELLADTLFSKMVLFHKMTRQICVKYHYALRTMKSTGFFISLLRDPNQKGKRDPKNDSRSTGQKRSRFTNMTGLFKNVPSLILSGDGEQLKRCPVYQDAIGFMAPRVGSHNTSSEDSARSEIQLPPLKPYKPITYISSSVRTESQNEASKRRRLNYGSPLKTADLAYGPLPSVHPVAPQKDSTDNYETLPPLERITGKLTPIQTANRIPPLNTSEVPYSVNAPMQMGIDNTSVSAFTSPASENSLGDLKPSFEDFLTQNANFNGIMINPSSIVEAVGFQNYDMQLPMTSDAVDFLPLDSTGIDELAEANGTQFPSWD